MAKQKELILASFVAMHTSVRTIDHLTDIINEIENKPTTSAVDLNNDNKLHLHRTKCSALIKFVIAPSLQAELIKDIGQAPFSLIVDESTDKLLCICVKYYSEVKIINIYIYNVVTQFLTFLSVVYTTAGI